MWIDKPSSSDWHGMIWTPLVVFIHSMGVIGSALAAAFAVFINPEQLKHAIGSSWEGNIVRRFLIRLRNGVRVPFVKSVVVTILVSNGILVLGDYLKDWRSGLELKDSIDQVTNSSKDANNKIMAQAQDALGQMLTPQYSFADVRIELSRRWDAEGASGKMLIPKICQVLQSVPRQYYDIDSRPIDVLQRVRKHPELLRDPLILQDLQALQFRVAIGDDHDWDHYSLEGLTQRDNRIEVDLDSPGDFYGSEAFPFHSPTHPELRKESRIHFISMGKDGCIEFLTIYDTLDVGPNVRSLTELAGKEIKFSAAWKSFLAPIPPPRPKTELMPASWSLDRIYFGNEVVEFTDQIFLPFERQQVRVNNARGPTLTATNSKDGSVSYSYRFPADVGSTLKLFRSIPYERPKPQMY